MSDLILRFFIGGVVVSLFSVLGDVIRPKSFAGLFAAAPSIALATVGLTISQHGKTYAALEGRSMIFGAIAFLFYAIFVSWLLRRYTPPTLPTTIATLPIWFAVSFGLWWVLGVGS